MQGNNKKTFPIGIDKSILNEDEINKLLKITSEKSLQAIARETEMLAGEGGYGSGGEMTRGDMKVTIEEIEDFLKEISPFNAPKVTRKELKSYLGAFPKQYSNKEIAFLMNGLYEMDSGQLYELLSSTQIEEFDAVEEAFKLLDVENKGFLTVETFKQIFKNLNLGEIAPSDEDIFKEVADFDGDGVINLVDFRKILTYKPEVKEDDQQVNHGGDDDEDQEAQPIKK
ncbi:UNKNOWN [Stylonychia lemnae]|uniref:EF-hand domain-containing protein n=1 Tax=Stylonychia lemnae TaxID=5949 RepID=A0A078B619_STYLE|nr:UNKNOWN [Stylonychia lemnae]|eukprot:CDW89671.1 UNKNOWN [Stylonychia lemnae]